MSNQSGEEGSFCFSSGEEDDVQQQQQQFLDEPSASAATNSNCSTSEQTAAAPPPPAKKKRNLPGTPDPTAEVIALSPGTLLATNRFVCEICNKGFQRDQNLQLHRRGHNLPWKLRQRTSAEVRKRVYVCPEVTCVHHHPSRALGDLTGIKKHFSRKHGEKKWKCDKCSKKYAVQSDWKAHSKTCGTREYKCDCGTIFSRRDSFITHRAFCDALAEENSKANQNLLASLGATLHAHLPELMLPIAAATATTTTTATNHSLSTPRKPIPLTTTTTTSMFSTTSSPLLGPLTIPSASSSLQLAGIPTPPGQSAHMSATALLQKAAQMGATASGSINSPMMQRNFVSGMAGHDQVSGAMRVFGPMQTPSFQFFDASPVDCGVINEAGMFSGIFPCGGGGVGEENNWGVMESIEKGGGKKVMHGSESAMTVDFLGVGRGRQGVRMHEKQQQQGMQSLHGLQGFQLQRSHGKAVLEKPTWDV